MNVLLFARPAAATRALAPCRIETPLHLVHPAILAPRAGQQGDLIDHDDGDLGRWRTERLA